MLDRFSSRVVKLTVLVVALVAVSAGLAACGPFGSKSAKDIVDETFSAGDKKEVDSGKFSVTFKGEELKGIKEVPDGTVDAKLSGTFDGATGKTFPKFDLSLTLNAGKTDISAGAISTGAKLFVSYQNTPYEVPEQLFGFVKSGYEQAQQQQAQQQKDGESKGQDQSLKQLGVDPNKWLTDLKKGSDEQVGGVDTYTVTGSVDVPKFAEDAAKLASQGSSLGGQFGSKDQPTPEEIKKAITESVKSVDFTLNSGKDDLILRRFEVDLTFDVPEDSQKDLSGLESGKANFAVEVLDIGQPQSIKEPTGAKPLNELLEKLGLDDEAAGLGGLGGLGDLGGSGDSSTDSGSGSGSSGGSSDSGGSTTTPDSDIDSGSSGSSSTPPPGANSKQTKEYLACVKGAGGPEDLQECVKKLQE